MQKIFIVEAYIIKKSYERSRRKCKVQFPCVLISSTSTLHKMISKSRKKKTWSRSDSKYYVFFSETLCDIGVRLEASRRNALSRLLQEIGISKSSVHAAIKLVYLHQEIYNYARLQYADLAAKVRFCNWLWEAMCSGEVDTCLIYCTHEPRTVLLKRPCK